MPVVCRLVNVVAVKAPNIGAKNSVKVDYFGLLRRHSFVNSGLFRMAFGVIRWAPRHPHVASVPWSPKHPIDGALYRARAWPLYQPVALKGYRRERAAVVAPRASVITPRSCFPAGSRNNPPPLLDRPGVVSGRCKRTSVIQYPANGALYRTCARPLQEPLALRLRSGFSLVCRVVSVLELHGIPDGGFAVGPRQPSPHAWTGRGWSRARRLADRTKSIPVTPMK